MFTVPAHESIQIQVKTVEELDSYIFERSAETKKEIKSIKERLEKIEDFLGVSFDET